MKGSGNWGVGVAPMAPGGETLPLLPRVGQTDVVLASSTWHTAPAFATAGYVADFRSVLTRLLAMIMLAGLGGYAFRYYMVRRDY